MTQSPAIRPFRFGVLAGRAADVAQWEALCRRCEEYGYGSFLVPDHLNREWGPLVALALAARVTRSIALGPLMLGAALRQPSVVYKELATLDLVAPGRLEIGVGAGWLASDFSRAGVDMEPGPARLRQTVEAVTVLRRLWDEGSATFLGSSHQVLDAVGEPRPSPARWTMGGGGPGMLRAAAELADIVSFSARLSSGSKDSSFGPSARAAEFDRRVRWVLEAGPVGDPPEFQCLLFAAAICASSTRYAERVLTHMFGLPPTEALDSPLALAGSVDEVCERLEERRKRYGISYWVLPAAQADAFAPVVARLAGK
ncbi:MULTISPECIES: TIGR03621 family F420-dependent LLM class oxidoreductase [Kitasatospora]|uniref:TIGR03621 family F420-dependent LLM class oxidoreductase n=1 Tax=Kitasatospora TaxID=2063 RepID=UPI000C70B634|nr:TIGR03621 family F420-dependent LLM class oxidoreductase [Kitasatospora sp. GP30]MDH6145157.1 putative F420-dependent oxidoreductase [Kitasatospora sp. GP30]